MKDFEHYDHLLTLIRSGREEDFKQHLLKIPLQEIPLAAQRNLVAASIRLNKISITKHLLEYKFDYFFQDDDGKLLSHYCCLRSVDFFELLCTHNIPINSTDYYGFSTFFYACQYKKKDIVLFLLKSGQLDINFECIEVLRKGYFDFFSDFIEAGFDFLEEHSLIALAIQFNHIDKFCFLLSQGAPYRTSEVLSIFKIYPHRLSSIQFQSFHRSINSFCDLSDVRATCHHLTLNKLDECFIENIKMQLMFNSQNFFIDHRYFCVIRIVCAFYYSKIREHKNWVAEFSQRLPFSYFIIFLEVFERKISNYNYPNLTLLASPRSTSQIQKKIILDSLDEVLSTREIDCFRPRPASPVLRFKTSTTEKTTEKEVQIRRCFSSPNLSSLTS